MLVHDSVELQKSFNLTELFKRNFDAESYRYNVPVLRDISYLPEEDYNVIHESNDAVSQDLDRQNRNLMPEYRNLCEVVTRKVQFDDENYEYQPPHYHEVYCKSYSRFDQPTERIKRSSSKQKCAHPGFHCVQRSRMLFVVRRAWDSDCWEPFTKEIPSGCDCMWPVSLLGDIAAHY